MARQGSLPNCVARPFLRQLNLERLVSHQTFERRDARLVFAQQLGRRHVRIERAGLRLVDPDPDQVARQVMASAKGTERLSSMTLGDNLALELDAVAAVSGHRLSPQKARLPSIAIRSICPIRGAHSTAQPDLYRHLPGKQLVVLVGQKKAVGSP